MANNLAHDFAGIMNLANGIIKKIETGDGIGLSPEQKKEFKKQVKENKDLPKLKADLKDKMKEFHEAAQKINHVKSN